MSFSYLEEMQQKEQSHSRRDDIAILRKMITYCNQAMMAARRAGNKNNFIHDPLYRNACIAPIEQIGELSKRIRLYTRNKYPEIPWLQLRNTRNRYAHRLSTISPSRTWQNVTQEIPLLKKKLDKCLRLEQKIQQEFDRKTKKKNREKNPGRHYLPKKKTTKKMQKDD